MTVEARNDSHTYQDASGRQVESQGVHIVAGGGGGGGGDASAANQVTTNDRVGALTETAPASDTASSGLNGRLQRIAQRLTSLIALLPASLGAKTSANSLAVALATDTFPPPVIAASTNHFAIAVDTSNAGNGLGALLGGTVLADQIAAGATSVLVTVETFPIRVRFDGGDASTIGHLYAKDNPQPYVFDVSDLTKIQMVGIGGSASVNVSFFK